MHAAHYSTLLPELFRHKTTRVRVPQPNAILLDFHGTISERRWEDKVISPYVRQALTKYLEANWNDEVIQKCLPGLRNESFEQRFRNKFEDAPVISDAIGGQDEVEPAQLVTQMSDFLLWQMSSKKETNETQLIERLVWRDGLKRRQIFTPIYEDVLPAIRDWNQRLNCSIYVISSLDSDTLQLLFENTNRGDLHQFLSGYLTPRRPGEKLASDLYGRFLTNLQPILKHSRRGQASCPTTKTNAQAGHKSHSPAVTTIDLEPKPVLFLTDSGQEAKAASQVNEGAAFECLLVNRPGNKPLRTFYLSQFAYIERFDDITFVAID